MRKIFTIIALQISILFAEIPFEQLHGIHEAIEEYTKNDKEKVEKYSPIYGFILNKKYVLSNLRKFGNYKAGEYEAGDTRVGRNYIGDEGEDSLTKILKIFFPSNDGNLSAMTNAKSNVGNLINDAKSEDKVEKLSQIFQIITNPTSSISNSSVKKLKVEGLKDLVKQFNEDDKNKYPVHLLEHIFIEFVRCILNDKKDLIRFYQAVGLIDKNKNPDEFSDLTPDDLQKMIEAETHNTEQLFETLYGMECFENQTPYDRSLPQNSTARAYNRSTGSEQENTKYADCGEITLLNFFNLMLYRATGQKFDIDGLQKRLEEKYGEKWIPGSAFKNLINFYQKIQSTKAQVNNADIRTRSAWVSVVGDLNAPATNESDQKAKTNDLKLIESYCENSETECMGRKIYYNHPLTATNNATQQSFEYEVMPGLLNAVNIIKRVLGIPYDENDKEFFEKAKTAKNNLGEYKTLYNKYIKIQFKNICTILLGAEKSDIAIITKDSDFSKEDTKLNPLDLLTSSMQFTINTRYGDVQFRLTMSKGHATANFNQERKKEEKIPENVLKQLDSQNNQILRLLNNKETEKNNTETEDFYKMYGSESISDYQSTINFLDKIVDDKSQQNTITMINEFINAFDTLNFSESTVLKSIAPIWNKLMANKSTLNKAIQDRLDNQNNLIKNEIDVDNIGHYIQRDYTVLIDGNQPTEFKNRYDMIISHNKYNITNINLGYGFKKNKPISIKNLGSLESLILLQQFSNIKIENVKCMQVSFASILPNINISNSTIDLLNLTTYGYQDNGEIEILNNSTVKLLLIQNLHHLEKINIDEHSSIKDLFLFSNNTTLSETIVNEKNKQLFKTLKTLALKDGKLTANDQLKIFNNLEKIKLHNNTVTCTLLDILPNTIKSLAVIDSKIGDKSTLDIPECIDNIELDKVSFDNKDTKYTPYIKVFNILSNQLETLKISVVEDDLTLCVDNIESLLGCKEFAVKKRYERYNESNSPLLKLTIKYKNSIKYKDEEIKDLVTNKIYPNGIPEGCTIDVIKEIPNDVIETFFS